ncbi:hypothetical protein [Serratia nevei]|uniref:hypothetical protein n=1 Tax=Serratia nevei TaxID=2703794 RepID=UPI00313EF475
MTIQIKRTDSNTSKHKTTDDLKTHLRDERGERIPNSVFGTDISRTEIVSQEDGTGHTLHVGYVDRSGRPQAFGNDVHDYVQTLEKTLNDTLNTGAFFEDLQEHVFPCEQRPFSTLPTPIQRETLTNRNVRFLNGGIYDPKAKPEGLVQGGHALMVSPVIADKDSKETGVLASAITHVSDFAMMGGWTSQSVVSTASDLVDQYLRNLTGSVVDVLVDTPDLQTVDAEALTGAPAVIADTILDTLAVNLPFHLGSSMVDYTLLVPEKYEAVLNRAAQKAGHSEIADLIGCPVAPYSGDGRGFFLMPQKYAMLSFRSTKDGDLIKVKVTREPSRAGYNMELIGAVDIMATGTVKVRDGVFDTEKAAAYPLVHRVVFGTSSK